MIERRENARDKVTCGDGSGTGARGSTRDCVVGNISENGTNLEYSNIVHLPKRDMALKADLRLTIARKARFFLARLMWWRDNFVGVAFSAEGPSDAPISNLEERLRKSEDKKRQLQRRINRLIAED